MKKVLGIVAALALVIVFTTPLQAGEGKAWFDMENCSLCAKFNKPELMASMKYESYKVENGIVSITTVPEAHRAAYISARTELEAEAEKMETGAEIPTCGYCESIGMLMQAGAKMEHVDGKAAFVMLFTASSPETVSKIHKHYKRTMDEMSKMASAGDHSKGHDEHAGHDHN